jgi:tRNA G18 (ribose-2'-O)-methylase SpoU
MGEERQGLDAEQRALCETLVRLRMVPGTDSLNLAVAGSLVKYEVFRCGSRKPEAGREAPGGGTSRNPW